MIADLLPTDDQRQIAESLERLFARHLALDRLREPALARGAAEAAAWPQLAEAGIFGLGLGSEQGGVGYGLPEEVIVARLAGRQLVSPIVLASMAACHVAAAAGDQALVEALAGGARRAAFANPVSGGDVHVVDAAGADLLLTWAGEGLQLFDAASAAGFRPVEAIDEALELRRGRLGGQAMIADASSGATKDRLSLLIAAYLVGVAEAARDMAVEYAKVRHQFGQPIGAFQGVKFACADMAVRAEAAQAQTFWAALDPAPHEVAAARLLAGQAARANGEANIQLHGAMGFTFEADAHRLLKRAIVMAALGGDLRAELKRVLAG